MTVAPFLASAGCSPPARTIQVVGRVTHNGVPVEGAVVVFYAEEHADDLPAAGRTDASGHYELYTYFTASDIPLGAVPNDYVVTVRKWKGPDIERAQNKMRDLAEAGGDINRYIAEGAIYDLWPDGAPDGWPQGFVPCVNMPPRRFLENNDLREKLARMVQGFSLLPENYADPATSALRARVKPSEGPLTFDFDLVGDIDEPLPLAGAEFQPGPAG